MPASIAKIPIALTIAGSDSSGGAGIQADLKTFSAFGVYGASVLTALTAQNTRGVQGVEPVRPEFVTAQLASVLDDLDVRAIKTGMLANSAIVSAVAKALGAVPAIPVVVDPVMVATSGDRLLTPDAVAAYKAELFPLATLVTPNLPEAAALLGVSAAATEDEAIAQARAIVTFGSRAVLVKGGHGHGAEAVDILVGGDAVVRLAAPRIETRHTHGTGCTLSAAIAALLARGEGLEAAVRTAKDYVSAAIAAGQELGVGHGSGPVDHLYAIRRGPPPV
ncbi:MAG: bifunctional hydroxymethylpyrimidine kinase/phosphomethylpyrimidine kinase [Hyphomicrobiaceae bacterium]